MTKRRDRIVYRRKDGRWADKRLDGERDRLHDTQRAAETAARETLKKAGGGELITKGRDGKGRDGKIRSKDTVEPGKDPHPPKDREH